MAFCTQCGNPLSDSVSTCPVCGAPNDAFVPSPGSETSYSPDMRQPVPPPVQDSLRSVANNVANAAYGVAASARSASDTFRQNQQELAAQREQSRHIVLADGEQIVKSYHCSNLILPRWSNGYITVTNKRILFEGRGGASRFMQEARLDDLSNIDAYYGLDFHILRFLIGVALAIGVLVSFATGARGIFSGLLMLIVGAVFIYFAFRKCFKIKVYAYANKNLTNVISLGALSLKALSSGAVYSLSGRPAKDTDALINELGALVLDLQTMGDRAIRKWK